MFLTLPGEIRNKIYKFAAALENPPNQYIIKSAVDRRELPRHVCAGDLQNRASITQPGLFHTCSQTYRESREIFYRYRKFKLRIWQDPGMKRQSRCLKKVLDWFDTIGVDMQKQVRAIEINLKCEKNISTDMKTYVWFVDNLHAKLSDQATVIYRPISQLRAKHDISFLYGIGKVIHVRDPSRGPQMDHPNWSIRGSPTPGNDADNDGGIWAWARNPLVYTPKKRCVERPSLTFWPDQGWFGREAGTGPLD